MVVAEGRDLHGGDDDAGAVQHQLLLLRGAEQVLRVVQAAQGHRALRTGHVHHPQKIQRLSPTHLHRPAAGHTVRTQQDRAAGGL